MASAAPSAALQGIVDLLLAGGYFRARIASLPAFDKVIGGLAWCLVSSDSAALLGDEFDLNYDEDAKLGEKVTAILGGGSVLSSAFSISLCLSLFPPSLLLILLIVLLDLGRSGFPSTLKKPCNERNAPTRCKLTRSKALTIPRFSQSCNGSSSVLSRRESSESRCIGSLLCKSTVGASGACRWTLGRWARMPKYSSILQSREGSFDRRDKFAEFETR